MDKIELLLNGKWADITDMIIHVGERTVGEFKARMLEQLTLDSVKAESLRLHVQANPGESPFDQLAYLNRLMRIGDIYGRMCRASGDGDPQTLGLRLIELAAEALCWAEAIDKEHNPINVESHIEVIRPGQFPEGFPC